MTNHINWRDPAGPTIPNLCSNHNIEPHYGHLTSQWMEDQHSQHKPKLNIIKMEDLYDTHVYRAKHNYPDTNPNPKGISRYSV
jgi:hypothetical protein